MKGPGWMDSAADRAGSTKGWRSQGEAGNAFHTFAVRMQLIGVL